MREVSQEQCQGEPVKHGDEGRRSRYSWRVMVTAGNAAKVEQVERVGTGKQHALGEMDIDLSGADVLVAEQLLDSVDVGPACDEVGGEAVAEGVDAAFSKEAGACLEFDEAFNEGAGCNGKVALTGSEEKVGFGMVGPNIAPEVCVEASRVECGTVFAAFALANPNGAMAGIEINDLQPAKLAETKAGGVGHDKNRLCLTAVSAGHTDEFLDLGGCPDEWQAFGLLSGGNDEVSRRDVEELVVKAAQGADMEIDGGPGKMPFFDEVIEVVLNLGIGKLIRFAVVMVSKIVNDVDIFGDRGRCVVANCQKRCKLGPEVSHR